MHADRKKNRNLVGKPRLENIFQILWRMKVNWFGSNTLEEVRRSQELIHVSWREENSFPAKSQNGRNGVFRIMIIIGNIYGLRVNYL